MIESDPEFTAKLKKQVEKITGEQAARKEKKRASKRKNKEVPTLSLDQELPKRNVSDISKRFHKTYNWRTGLPQARALDIADGLLEWLQDNPDALSVNEFLIAASLHPYEYRRLLDKSPELERSNQIAKMVLGTRRESGAIKGIYHAGMVVRSMPMYDNGWKELEEWRSKLANKKENPEPVQVHIYDITKEE